MGGRRASNSWPGGRRAHGGQADTSVQSPFPRRAIRPTTTHYSTTRTRAIFWSRTSKCGLVQVFCRPKNISRIQFGGLPYRGTRDAIAIVEDITERVATIAAKRAKSKRHDQKLFIVIQGLFDLSKAFDKIDRCKLWEAMRALFLREALVLFLEDIHDGACILIRDVNWSSRSSIAKPVGSSAGLFRGPLVFHLAVRSHHSQDSELARRPLLDCDIRHNA